MQMFAAAALLVLVSCGGPAVPVEESPSTGVDPVWRSVDVSALDEIGGAQLAKAAGARKEMAETLMAELKGELEAGGPGSAITVCRDMAPMVAEYVADEHEVRIGRTSHRLRTPGHNAPAWAISTVDAQVAAEQVFLGPAGELGVLTPISVAKPCLACHGNPEAISVEVAAALSENYPEDRATGFAEGDLRGWFWVEVPPAVSTDPQAL